MSAKGDTQNKYSVVSASIVAITLPAVLARPLRESLQSVFNARISQRAACEGCIRVWYIADPLKGS